MTKAPEGAEEIFCRSCRSFRFGRTKTHGFTVGYYRSPLRGSSKQRTFFKSCCDIFKR